MQAPAPASTPTDFPAASLEPLGPAWMDALLAVEQSAHAHPWTRGHFTDALAAGYAVQCLVAGPALLGYFVAMPGVEEAHLLNLTVAPAWQRQGCARLLLDALALWARARGAACVWLEVRASNARALHVYTRHGFARVAVRPGYYPAAHGQREDAVVMRLPL